MGIRPEEFGGPFSTNLVVVVLSSVVLGGVLGFASGGITSRVLARARNSDAAASRLATSLNAVVLYFVVIPSLSLLFTFAHFTGTSSRWDILEAPFVLLIALMTLGGLGVVHAALVGVFVIAHRTVAHGIGTALLDGLVSAVLATGAVVGGVLFLDKGIEDFPDQLSFSVAAGATLGFAALIGATFGAGWGRARRGPAQAKAR